tara:strand:- start:32 stop:256 length:225 start_codon:yes stop_codon:yes gene_type:complete
MSETMTNIKKQLGKAPGGKQLNIEFAGDKARKAMLEDRKKVNRNIAMFGIAPPVAMQGMNMAKESSLLKLGFKK